MGTPLAKTTYSLPSVGVAETFIPPPTSKLGLPKSMDLESLMLWLGDRMKKSDAEIRSKMADMDARTGIQSEMNDLVLAFRESRTGADCGHGAVAVKAPLDNPEAIRNSEWFQALDPEIQAQVESILGAIHPPAYKFTGESFVSYTGHKYVTGDWVPATEAGGAILGGKGAYFTPIPARVKTAEIDNLVESLGDIGKNLASSDEIEMIELQSAISARGQLLQMVSNMIASFNETAKNIVGNVRG